LEIKGTQGPHSKHEAEHPWWKVMCLTGVDYFSTLGYQPGIAFLAAGALSPLATLVLVLLTLFGALPIYRHVAKESPHGEGSIAMLEHLLTWWNGKLFVLMLLGFAFADFMITITLSAADASAHLIQNPFAPHFFHGQPVPITLFLVALLGGVFLKGFKEAIGIAVILVGAYLTLNLIVVVIGLEHIAAQPQVFANWKTALITTLLIPADAFRAVGPSGEPAGPANGRALAYLAHQFLGDGFGTVYDLSTIAILWFAGASAMAGLLNIVPRYLPRYGMAPEWTRATRPLVLIYMAIGFALTLLFRADVDAQGGAYATGVLVLMTSAAVAVTLSVWAGAHRVRSVCFGLITLVFVYTTLVNVIERPDGLKIGAFFIVAIVLSSLVSRVWRTTELRVKKITLDREAQRFIDKMDAQGELRIIANQPRRCDDAEYTHREEEQREDNNIPLDEVIVFLEIYVRDASEFSADLNVQGISVGRHRVLRGESAAVANAIAAFLLYLGDDKGKVPHAYFNWTEGNPLLYLIHYVLSGEGDVAPVTREVLRKAEPNAQRRPAIHAGI
jgi:hypothetical protein